MQVDLSQPIDVTKDTFEIWYKKLAHRAYRGNVPEGGYDLPSPLIVNRCDEDLADYTVAVDPLPDGVRLSFDESLCPPVAYPEPVAKHSEVPFGIPFEDTVPPGFFASSVQNFSKAKAVIDSYKGESKGLEQVFKGCWGLDESTDLEDFSASVRSSGPAMWGGVMRNNVPAVQALSGTQGLVHIIERGATKQKFAEDALIDWPRAKAVAMAVGVQLAGDDKVARGRGLELHYRIPKVDVPKAPKGIVMPHFPDANPVVSEAMKENLLNLAKHIRKFSLLKGKKYDNLFVREVKPPDIMKAIRLIGEEVKVPAHSRLFESTLELTDEILYGQVARIDHQAYEEIKKIRPVDILKSIAYGYADRERGNILRAREIRKTIVDLDVSFRDSFSALSILAREVIPEDFLVRVYYLGNLIGKGLGFQWVNDIRKYLNMPHSAFSESDLIKSWNASLNNRKVLVRICEEIANAFRAHESIRKYFPKVRAKVCRLLGTKQMFLAGLNEVIHTHAAYWHNRYVNKPYETNEDLAKNQLMSKVMRNVQVELSDKLQVREDRIFKILHDSAHHYVNKRMNQPVKEEMVPHVRWYTLEEYAQVLDGWIIGLTGKPPNLKYQDFVIYCKDNLGKFLVDIQEFLDKVLFVHDDWEPEEHETYGADFKTEHLQDVAEDRKEETMLHEAEDGQVGRDAGIVDSDHQMAKMSHPAHEAEDDEDEFFVLDTPMAKQDPTVDLLEELMEDGVRVDHPIAQRIISQYPARVLAKDIAAIKKEILMAYRAGV